MSTKRDRPNIGVITFPISAAGTIPLSNLIDILRPLSGHIHLITGNAGYALFRDDTEIYTYNIEHKEGTNVFTRVINYILTQLKISFRMMKVARDVDFYLFKVGGQDLLIPVLTGKLLGKNVMLAFAGSSVDTYKARKDILYILLNSLEKIVWIILDRIVVHSERLIEEWDLEKHRSKILIAYEYFLDFSAFKIQKPLNKRDNLISYIGRLSEEKGALNFVRAIPKVLQRRDVRFLIGGHGHLRTEIEEYLNDENLSDKVKVVGWIPHERLPRYLNDSKLLVVPSYTESGPLIVLEAMACGALVLGSQKGIMPDIINHGKNGFLLENNSSECIAKNILEILSRKDLLEISYNARKTVEKTFTYEAAVEGYEKIIKTSKMAL